MIQLAVAAYAAWILERTKKALKEAGATSEETAKTPNEQVGADAVFCPNCGAPVTLQPIQHAIQSPKLASSFRRYFSKPFIYCIILRLINMAQASRVDLSLN